MAPQSQTGDPEPGSRLRAIIFDAGGTLIHMPSSREEILAGLCHQLGHPIDLREASEAAIASEAYYVRHYLAHRGEQGPFWHRYHGAALQHLGITDPTGEKAAFLSHGFGRLGVWRAYPEAAEACARIRSAGLQMAVVSNGPATVSRLLSEAGLLDYFDAVITSQEEGIEKPDPRIFRTALESIRVSPAEALFVGDLYETDVLGARAAGMEAILIDREGAEQGRDCPVARNLIDLLAIMSIGEADSEA